MVKVIQAFRERYHEMKLYSIGDDYPENDEDRVQYLTGQGFLQEDEKQRDEPLNIEQFAAMTAAEQKDELARLNIEGDDGNSEKREKLYAEYLTSVSANGNPNA